MTDQPYIPQTTEEMLAKIQLALEELEPYVYHRVKHHSPTSSIYVNFEDERIRSLRIGDHNGREKYRYKWNLRKDMTGPKTEQDGKVKRFYYGWDSWVDMVRHITNYAHTIKRSDVEDYHQ